MKKVLIGLVCLLLVCGCGNVKLKNGENAVVTFNEGGISSEELYKELKEQYGAEVLTDLIDKYLLEKKYEKTSEETKNVNQMVKTLKENAKKANVSFETYISAYYGLKDEVALRNLLSLTYKRSQWAQDYAKETVTDKQINDYYETEVYGDIEASQILITSDANSNSTDEEKTKAENDALEKARNIIKEIQGGKDFATAAKEYSKDSTSAKNGGSLGKVNNGDLPDEALDALRNLKDGSYTTSPVKTSEGYHILYRTSQDAKPELTDTLKQTIIETIAKEIAQESGFSATALKALREQNGMKFVDTELEKDFESSNN